MRSPVEAFNNRVDKAFTYASQLKRLRAADVANLQRIATMGKPEGDRHPAQSRGRGGVGGSLQMIHNTPQPRKG